MLDYFLWYCGVGFGVVSLTTLGFFVIRHRLDNPCDTFQLTVRIFFYLIVWPLFLLSIFKHREIAFLFESVQPVSQIPNLKQAIREREAKLKALWDSPPLCGQHVFARGVNEAEYIRLSSAFIFDAAQLAAILESNCFSKGDFQSDEAAIARWLSYRDTQLNCITKVPNPWGRMSYVIEEAIENGVGEVFCPTCHRCYPASQLVKPLTTFKAGWNFNIINCPENHLLHQTKGMHINMG